MNLSSNTIGLLIQGPIMSIGQGASNYKEYSDESTEIIHHNCENTIMYNINKYKKLFTEIVISTWDDEKTTSQFKNFCINQKNVKIYQFKKNKNLVLGKKLINNNYTRNYNNLVQYTGCFLGIQKIISSKYVVRIRTDQIIDLEKIIKQMVNIKNKIFVPGIYYKNKFFQIEDFYFAGEKKILEDFFKISSQNLYHRSAQINPPLAYMFFVNKKLNLEDLQINSPLIQVMTYNIIIQHFSPLSIDVFKNINWRGQHASPSWLVYHSNKVFFENISQFNLQTYVNIYKSFYVLFFGKKINFFKRILKKLLKTIYSLPL